LIEIVFIGEARQTRHKLGQEVAGALVAEGDGGGAMDGVTHAVMDPARAGFAEIARRHTRHPFGMFGQRPAMARLLKKPGPAAVGPPRFVHP
jgi:hypothetical protein